MTDVHMAHLFQMRGWYKDVHQASLSLPERVFGPKPLRKSGGSQYHEEWQSSRWEEVVVDERVKHRTLL